MPQNKSIFIASTLMNTVKRTFSLFTIPILSFSISVPTQAQEYTEEFILLEDIYSALSLNNENNTPFLYGLPNDIFYQFSQNIGMHNVVIDYFSHIEDVNNINDVDTFYAAHIRDETGASLRIAFNSNSHPVAIDFGDSVIHVEPSSAYVALRDVDRLFAMYDFGGDIGLKGEAFDIFFPYSALFSPVTTQGLSYIIIDNTISIENLGVRIQGWNYIIGTPDDDTFLITNTFGLQEVSIANTFTIDGGGGEDIISFEAMGDIDSDETISNNYGDVTLDMGVIHINTGDVTLNGGNLSFNDSSPEDSFDVISGDILLENDNVTVIDGGSVSVNFPIQTTPETILGDTEAITIIDSSDITFTANEPASDVLEEDEKTGGGSFHYLTLCCLALFSFLQQLSSRKITF